MSLEGRTAGVLVGPAAGDALEAGYELAAPPSGDAAMVGGGLGGWSRGVDRRRADGDLRRRGGGGATARPARRSWTSASACARRLGAAGAAWSAVSQTPQDGPGHLQRALHAAVRIGDDTDTVAAIPTTMKRRASARVIRAEVEWAQSP